MKTADDKTSKKTSNPSAQPHLGSFFQIAEIEDYLEGIRAAWLRLRLRCPVGQTIVFCGLSVCIASVVRIAESEPET